MQLMMLYSEDLYTFHSFSFILFYLNIYPPDSQKSDGGANA